MIDSIKGYIWLARRVGVRRANTYERERRRRKRLYGQYIPSIHGAGLLRAVGATEEQIAEAKRRGLA